MKTLLLTLFLLITLAAQAQEQKVFTEEQCYQLFTNVTDTEVREQEQKIHVIHSLIEELEESLGFVTDSQEKAQIKREIKNYNHSFQLLLKSFDSYTASHERRLQQCLNKAQNSSEN